MYCLAIGEIEFAVRSQQEMSVPALFQAAAKGRASEPAMPSDKDAAVFLHEERPR